MDKRDLLLEMTGQFYEDCSAIASHSPMQQADEETCMMFNNLLREVQTSFSYCALLGGFREMAPRNVKFKDAVVVAGQLLAIMRTLHRASSPLTDVSGVSGAPSAPGQAGISNAPAGVSGAPGASSDVFGPAAAGPHPHTPFPAGRPVTSSGASTHSDANPSTHADVSPGRPPSAKPGRHSGAPGGYLTPDELRIRPEDLQ